MKKRVLVTGGAGFIGSNFCNLSKDRYEMKALDSLFLGDLRNLDPDIPFFHGDACLEEDLQKIGPVDIVLHLAGTSSAPMFLENPTEAYRNSIDSFLTTIQWAQKNGVQKFLYASTSSLYGNNPLPLVETQSVIPPNHYAVSKKFYEDSSRTFHQLHSQMDCLGFRFMSVYGPHEEAKGRYANIISQFAWDMARDRQPVIYGDGSQTRDFTNVQDVVSALVLTIEYPKQLGAEIFNIGTGRATSLNEIVTALNRAFQKNIAPKYIENPVKEGYVQGQAADISKIQQILGYQPRITLEQGILDQVKNLRLDRIRETSSDLLR